MGKQFNNIEPNLMEFIKKQKMFFVGTAASTGLVNVSPKGLDTLRIIDENRVVWLNLTGSGNETAAHLLQNNRITIMFCAFEGRPLILRLYGTAKIYHAKDTAWSDHIHLFPDILGARQIMDIQVDMVQTSCGFAVPLMDFKEERSQLTKWAEHKGEDGVKAYQQEKNKQSLDGFPTGLK